MLELRRQQMYGYVPSGVHKILSICNSSCCTNPSHRNHNSLATWEPRPTPGIFLPAPLFALGSGLDIGKRGTSDQNVEMVNTRVPWIGDFCGDNITLWITQNCLSSCLCQDTPARETDGRYVLCMRSDHEVAGVFSERPASCINMSVFHVWSSFLLRISPLYRGRAYACFLSVKLPYWWCFSISRHANILWV